MKIITLAVLAVCFASVRYVPARIIGGRIHVKEIQQKVLPRVPAWQVEVKRGGS